jgi:hypothetical protein
MADDQMTPRIVFEFPFDERAAYEADVGTNFRNHRIRIVC